MSSSRSLVLQAITAVVLTLGLVWAATQWAAAMLGHQPALGTPWIGLGGVKVYAPWKLFAWWLAFDAQAPDVFRRAGARCRARGHRQRRSSPSGEPPGGPSRNSQATTYGSARWADSADVRDAGLLARQRRRARPLSTTATCATTVPSMCWPWRRPAPARASAWCVPTLLTWPGSAVIHDIKGENWQLTAGWRSQLLALPAVRSDQPRCRPASIRCSRCARARTRCATCRTSPTSWSIRKARASGATTGRRPRTRC